MVVSCGCVGCWVLVLLFPVVGCWCVFAVCFVVIANWLCVWLLCGVDLCCLVFLFVADWSTLLSPVGCGMFLCVVCW